MTVLLDTHAFLWWVLDDARLGTTAREVIRSGGRPVCLSLVSIWEIAIKQGLGRRVSGASVGKIMEVAFEKERFAEIGVERADLLTLEALPRHHQDPFDRLLLAQAMARGAALMTGDGAFQAYDCDLIDARA